MISAFKRLGKEADRETKQQNRQIERNYRELVGEIEHILSNITDFFIEITRGGDIEDAFKQLGERVAESFLDVFTRDISENFAASLTNLALRRPMLRVQQRIVAAVEPVQAARSKQQAV